MRKQRVLFLCTGNSARSQMAEGLVNHFLSENWEARSAGVAPAERVHPLAIAAMAELGIDISTHTPKSTEGFRDQPFDMVITVCDHAAKHCPAWLGKGEVVHIGFPDPAAAEEVTKLEVFRKVRDALKQQVLDFLVQWKLDNPRFFID
ncbi:MAG: Arsenate-mycothiol transferase ArsC2 [Chloroflexi bacterium ADurb.Bin360]|nr:MAG: Arsenate-mycothiol transferase ArsC2 [Chloroflexi bacterium ADurb.Bin360]